MPGEMFRTQIEELPGKLPGKSKIKKAEDARRFRAPVENEKLLGMIHVPYAGWDDISWVWIRPEHVSYVEAPSERGGWYCYRWKCGGRIMDFSYFVGREKCGEMEAVSEEERERRIAEVNLQWSMFYDQVVCGGLR